MPGSCTQIELGGQPFGSSGGSDALQIRARPRGNYIARVKRRKRWRSELGQAFPALTRGANLWHAYGVWERRESWIFAGTKCNGKEPAGRRRYEKRNGYWPMASNRQNADRKKKEKCPSTALRTSRAEGRGATFKPTAKAGPSRRPQTTRFGMTALGKSEKSRRGCRRC